jgi:TolB protein
MGSDGSQPSQVTDLGGRAWGPAWSPDGKRIAFTFADGTGDRDIYVMDADGSNVVQLTFDDGEDDSPCWSPVLKP